MFRNDEEFIDCYTVASRGRLAKTRQSVHHYEADSSQWMQCSGMEAGGDDLMVHSGTAMMQLVRDVLFTQVDSVPACVRQPPQGCATFVVSRDASALPDRPPVHRVSPGTDVAAPTPPELTYLSVAESRHSRSSCVADRPSPDGKAVDTENAMSSPGRQESESRRAVSVSANTPSHSSSSVVDEYSTATMQDTFPTGPSDVLRQSQVNVKCEGNFETATTLAAAADSGDDVDGDGADVGGTSRKLANKESETVTPDDEIYDDGHDGHVSDKTSNHASAGVTDSRVNKSDTVSCSEAASSLSSTSSLYVENVDSVGSGAALSVVTGQNYDEQHAGMVADTETLSSNSTSNHQCGHRNDGHVADTPADINRLYSIVRKKQGRNLAPAQRQSPLETAPDNDHTVDVDTTCSGDVGTASCLQADPSNTATTSESTSSYPGRPDLQVSRRLLTRGSLLLAHKRPSLTTSDTPPPLANNELQNFVGTVLAFDKYGSAFYVPAADLKEHGDPAGEPWFFPVPLTSFQATVLLSTRQTDGCFLVHREYRPAEHSTQYSLAVRYGADVLHYGITTNKHGDLSVAGHDRSFLSLSDLVGYFRRDKSSLATRLGQPLSVAHLPVTAGLDFDAGYELSRSQVRLSGNIIGIGRFGVVCAGECLRQPVAVKVGCSLSTSLLGCCRYLLKYCPLPMPVVSNISAAYVSSVRLSVA